MSLEGVAPESWNCIDCGFNTAPGLLNRKEIEEAFSVVRVERSAPMTVDERSEVYTVKDKIWKAAGVPPMGGCLCVGCLEKRLGRRLSKNSFLPNHPFNRMPGTERLLSRREPR